MITFRRAEVSDAELLARTRQRAWDATYRGIYADEMIDGYDLESFRQRDARRLSAGEDETWLVMDGGTCGGYFSYGKPAHRSLPGHSFCLNSLYLLPPYQRRGLGSRIFAQVRGACRDRGLTRFFCGCNCHNLPAQAFYRRMGGTVVAVDDGHTDPAEDQLYFEFDIGEDQ